MNSVQPFGRNVCTLGTYFFFMYTFIKINSIPVNITKLIVWYTVNGLSARINNIIDIPAKAYNFFFDNSMRTKLYTA